MKNVNVKIWVIRILVLIGLALSIELAIVYYNANFVKTALYSFCSINDYIDCDGVAKTYYSQFAGIPLAWWGVFLYSFILLLTVVEPINKFIKTPLQAFKAPLKYISVLGLISFCISMILAGISHFTIKKICILCLGTYFLDLLISYVATDFKAGGYADSFKTSIKDFIDGVKNYKVAFSVFMVFAIGFLTYSTVTFKFTPHLKFHRSVKRFIDAKTNPYTITGNQLGTKDGKVKLILITDYVCPMCRVNNMVVHKVVRDYEGIDVIHYNYPLDKTCNKEVMAQIHPGACMLSKIAIAAKQQGKYWETASALYDVKSHKTEELMKMARKLKLDEKKLWYTALSKETEKELLDEIDFCGKQDIDGTPAMIINGEKFVGLKNYETLSKIVEEKGATKRKR